MLLYYLKIIYAIFTTLSITNHLKEKQPFPMEMTDYSFITNYYKSIIYYYFIQPI